MRDFFHQMGDTMEAANNFRVQKLKVGTLSYSSCVAMYLLSIFSLSTRYLLSIYSVSAQYVSIYSVSTQYLHSIYSISTQYLHSSGVHSVSTVPGVETAASVSCAATAGGGGCIHLHSVALVATMGIHIMSVKLT